MLNLKNFQLMESVNNMEIPKNQGGRPSAAEAEQHYDGALQLYLEGVVNGSEIGRRLGLSPQAGVELVKRVRASFARADSDDDVSVRLNLAHRRAQHLIYTAWENYKTATDNKERDAAIKTIKEVNSYLFEIQGLRQLIGG